MPLFGAVEVLSRHEANPHGPLEYKRVEEVFRTTAPIWHLHVGGQLIRTTSEHPFWVEGRGWTAAKELRPGDSLVDRDGKRVLVGECIDAGYEEAVYNCRVADFATYYVGDREAWGFDVWAHNTCAQSIIGQMGEGQAKAELRNRGYTVLGSITNSRNNGIDIFARNRDGVLEAFEVKASTTAVAPALSVAQSSMRSFVIDRLQRAAGIIRDPRWENVTPTTKALAQNFLDEIAAAEDAGRVGLVGQVIRITNLFSSRNVDFSAWR